MKRGAAGPEGHCPQKSGSSLCAHRVAQGLTLHRPLHPGRGLFSGAGSTASKGGPVACRSPRPASRGVGERWHTALWREEAPMLSGLPRLPAASGVAAAALKLLAGTGPPHLPHTLAICLNGLYPTKCDFTGSKELFALV